MLEPMSSIHVRDSYKKGELYLKKGQKFYHNQNFKEANRWLDQALEKFTSIEAIFKMAEVLDIKGKIAEFEVRYEDALSLFEKSADLRRDRSHTSLQAESFYNLARIYFHLKKDEEALSHALKAYDLFEMGEPTIKNAEITFLLSQIYHDKGDFKSAAFYLSLTQDFLKKHPNHPFELLVLENSAHVHLQLGDLVKAEKLFLKALQREHELGNFMIVLKILEPLMEIYLDMEDFKEAKRIFTDFLKIYRILKENLQEMERSRFQFTAAKVLFELGDFYQAEEYCQEAIENNEINHNPDYRLLAKQLIHMAKILIHTSTTGTDTAENLDSIIPYLEEAKGYAEKEALYHLQVEILMVYERIARLKGDIRQARTYQDQALKIAQKPSNQDFLGMAEIWEEKAIEFHNSGDLEQARTFFLKAKEDFEQAKAFRRLANVYYNLACISARLHLPDDVLRYLDLSLNLNPKFRRLAQSDEDFRGLHDDEIFQQLVKE